LFALRKMDSTTTTINITFFLLLTTLLAAASDMSSQDYEKMRYLYDNLPEGLSPYQADASCLSDFPYHIFTEVSKGRSGAKDRAEICRLQTVISHEDYASMDQETIVSTLVNDQHRIAREQGSSTPADRAVMMAENLLGKATSVYEKVAHNKYASYATKHVSSWYGAVKAAVIHTPLGLEIPVWSCKTLEMDASGTTICQFKSTFSPLVPDDATKIAKTKTKRNSDVISFKTHLPLPVFLCTDPDGISYYLSVCIDSHGVAVGSAVVATRGGDYILFTANHLRRIGCHVPFFGSKGPYKTGAAASTFTKFGKENAYFHHDDDRKYVADPQKTPSMPPANLAYFQASGKLEAVQPSFCRYGEGVFSCKSSPGGQSGDSGCPLFNSEGRLIGIYQGSKPLVGAQIYEAVPPGSICSFLKGVG